MWKRLLKGTEFSVLLDMVSPRFFEVLPARELLRQGRDLHSNYKNDARYMEAVAERSQHLARADIGVAVGAVPSGERPPAEDATARGEAVLRLYFHQIFHGDTALLDLRSPRFEHRGARWIWDPAKIYLRWEPEFIEQLREMYRGFYSGDDARFEAALDALDLRCAEKTFREQFGAGDQRAVRFAMKDFVATFHEAFTSCKTQGQSLHRNFVGLGIYLAFLYDHLESLGGGPFDVRTAYERGSR